MSAEPQRLLLVSLSARMLVQSACRGGWRPLVLDLFGDQDTREMAQRCLKVKPSVTGFEATSLLLAAHSFFSQAQQTVLIYGSGFDACPDLLKRLSRRFVLFGNEPETVRLLKQPKRFFALLQNLNIPYPQSRFVVPREQQGWLVKKAFSEGGRGVHHAEQRPFITADDYVQRRLTGPVMSALFLADGAKTHLIGFNTQWSADHNHNQPFLFSGVISTVALSPDQRRQVADYVSRLVSATGLRGLNSLDFMLDGDQCQVLEVNPRPSASIALYDDDFPSGLLTEHIRAFQGKMADRTPSPTTIRAYQILYAPAHVVVPVAVAWPPWSHDRPPGGTATPAGHPFCAITASGSTEKQVRRQLQWREKVLLDQFFDFRRSA